MPAKITKINIICSFEPHISPQRQTPSVSNTPNFNLNSVINRYTKKNLLTKSIHPAQTKKCLPKLHLIYLFFSLRSMHSLILLQSSSLIPFFYYYFGKYFSFPSVVVLRLYSLCIYPLCVCVYMNENCVCDLQQCIWPLVTILLFFFFIVFLYVYVYLSVSGACIVCIKLKSRRKKKSISIFFLLSIV